jgi:hypothetical protein
LCTKLALFTRHWININFWSDPQTGLSLIKVTVYSIIKYRVEGKENSAWQTGKHLDIMEGARSGNSLCNKTLHLKPKVKNLTRWAEDTIIFGAKRVLITCEHLVDLKGIYAFDSWCSYRLCSLHEINTHWIQFTTEATGCYCWSLHRPRTRMIDFCSLTEFL